MEDVTTLVQSVKKISSLPTIFVRVNELINDPTSCANDLGRVIEKDQALTSGLLKLANSAFYGFPGRIDTVSRAITIIGFKQLRELVLAVSVRSAFSEFGQDSPINMTSFWEHSIACGIASRVLAIYSGETIPETHFVAGFLHDFGRLILLENYPQKYKEVHEVVRTEAWMTTEVEKEVFGFTHTDVGGELIRAWNLPESLVEAVRFHHEPEKATHYGELTAIVHLANIIVQACEIGFSGEFLVPPLSDEAWRKTGLQPGVLEPVVDKLYEQFEDMRAFLMSDELTHVGE
ncbi:MAG: HDOD domain-containing protein [Calditrichaeota bacterium]|nr:MAG: HDOD domain-containing protein [Calditrichota bacterium]